MHVSGDLTSVIVGGVDPRDHCKRSNTCYSRLHNRGETPIKGPRSGLMNRGQGFALCPEIARNGSFKLQTGGRYLQDKDM